jgi:hypothetical protein
MVYASDPYVFSTPESAAPTGAVTYCANTPFPGQPSTAGNLNTPLRTTLPLDLLANASTQYRRLLSRFYFLILSLTGHTAAYPGR